MPPVPWLKVMWHDNMYGECTGLILHFYPISRDMLPHAVILVEKVERAPWATRNSAGTFATIPLSSLSVIEKDW